MAFHVFFDLIASRIPPGQGCVSLWRVECLDDYMNVCGVGCLSVVMSLLVSLFLSARVSACLDVRRSACLSVCMTPFCSRVCLVVVFHDGQKVQVA